MRHDNEDERRAVLVSQAIGAQPFQMVAVAGERTLLVSFSGTASGILPVAKVTVGEQRVCQDAGVRRHWQR